MSNRSYLALETDENPFAFQIETQLSRRVRTRTVQVNMMSVTRTWEDIPGLEFSWSEDGGNNFIEVTITGSPSMSALTTLLSEGMTDASGIAAEYEVTFNQTTGLITIESTEDFQLPEADPDSLNKVLGFTEETGDDDTHIANNVPLLSRYSDIYIRSVGLNIINQSDDILGIVPVTGTFGDELIFNPENRIKKTVSGFPTDEITLRITDKDGENIDLRGGRWSVLLQVSKLSTEIIRLP